MNKFISILGLAAALAIVLLLFLPLDDAISIGGDDGFELSKSLLVAHKPSEAPSMWNDQPWLHTLVTAFLFRVFGDHAAIPRLLSFFSAMGLVLAIRHLIQRDGRPVEFACATMFLLSSDQFTYLMFSAMVEIPAISLATIAAVWAASSARANKIPPLVLAGAAFAAALHIKLTALIVLPAAIVIILMSSESKRRALDLCCWSVGVVAMFGLLMWISPQFSFENLLALHFAAREIMSKTAPTFHMSFLLLHPALLFAAVLGILSARRRRTPTTVFALTLLASASLVAAFQRPWWRFYMVHLDVPLSILAGVGAGDLFSRALEAVQLLKVRRVAPARESLSSNSVNFSATAASSILALWLAFTIPTTLYQLSIVSEAPRASKDAICQGIRKYATSESRCFTFANYYAFAGGVLMPPELVVLPKKRFVATDLSNEQVLAIVKRHNPDLLLLRKNYELTNNLWLAWVTNNFKPTQHNDQFELWVADRRHPHALDPVDPRLSRFQL